MLIDSGDTVARTREGFIADPPTNALLQVALAAILRLFAAREGELRARKISKDMALAYLVTDMMEADMPTAADAASAGACMRRHVRPGDGPVAKLVQAAQKKARTDVQAAKDTGLERQERDERLAAIESTYKDSRNCAGARAAV